ncbi:MAG: ABC transporter substrate-binding protein [Alphaproteobacteria bacterium]|nr:ABC transporter substrate-binding protein [Alphaproteobacteria bacterium]
MKRFLFLAALLLLAVPAWASTPAKEPIKIGELYPYSALPDDAQKWQQGWKLALEEVNAAGGVLGHPMEIISRDDKGNPSEAIKILEDFKNRENIKLFMGTAHGHVGLAASTFAKQNHMLLFRGYGGTSELTTTAGHDLYLTIQPPCDAWAGMLAEKAAQSGKKRWAFVAADYATSRSVIEGFQRDIKRLSPQTEFVETQYFPIGKLDAGAVTQAVGHAKPDGLFVVMWGTDYLKFVREGRKRGLFNDLLVIGPYAGYSAYIKPLGNEAPVGWFSAVGYPVDKIEGQSHKAFATNFKKIYNDDPSLSSLYGYDIVKILAQSIAAVGSDDPANVTAYIKAHKFDVPGTTLSFRADGISSMGDWVGYTGFENGVPTILNPESVNPAKYLPSAAENIAKWTK